MKNDLFKALRFGNFPNNKNRVWTMCNVALQMCLMAMEEAEKYNFVDEQFYIEFENSINSISVKDHSGNAEQDKEFEENVKNFMADSGVKS